MSSYNYKIKKYLYDEIEKIPKPLILEFGVRDGISTNFFLDLCKKNNGKLYSVDVNDCSKVSNDSNWTFIKSRDDNFGYIEKNIPQYFDIIYLDTLHEADHVEKIFNYYYSKLKVNGYFYIDDISWLPYVNTNNFYSEINNYETFERILEIFYVNEKNFDLNINFNSSGLCKIFKKNYNPLNISKKIRSRKYSLKNIFRKIYKKIFIK
jgi:predicted O-methyltransferase YrrM